MYTKESTDEKQAVPVMYTIVAILAIACNIAIGLWPNLVSGLL
jgi:NADH-quinone oxidoreductase subunit N